MQSDDFEQLGLGEYRHEMPYKGGAKGAETPTTGYIAGTHAHITERGRVEQLAALGLETREEHVDVSKESKDAQKAIKSQRIWRTCLLFSAMFCIAIIVGVLVSVFWNLNIAAGVGVAAAIGFVVCLLPMIFFLITNIRKK